jgi:Xaa-Pro aminopeptidase
MVRMTELELKINKIQGLLEGHSLDAMLLKQVDNFAWATCGAESYVNLAATHGASWLLVSPSGRFVITDNIEATRLRQEEHLEEQGWEFRVAPWFEANQAIAELTRGLKVGADCPYPDAADLSAEFPRLRASLTEEEGDRFRSLSRLCAEAMDRAIQAVRPGMTEYQIAGILAGEAHSRGVQPTVNLIAADERIYRFRHPLPTGKQLARYAMLILCGRKWGLVCSITRLVHFGPLPGELCHKAEAVAYIDARFIAGTRPGRKLCEIFSDGIEAYRERGYPEEWKLHHQGGPAGYEPREFIATPESQGEVSAGQVFAWNPSITGVKSEDTILVGREKNEVLTTISGWPTVKVDWDGMVFERPAILEVC